MSDPTINQHPPPGFDDLLLSSAPDMPAIDRLSGVLAYTEERTESAIASLAADLSQALEPMIGESVTEEAFDSARSTIRSVLADNMARGEAATRPIGFFRTLDEMVDTGDAAINRVDLVAGTPGAFTSTALANAATHMNDMSDADFRSALERAMASVHQANTATSVAPSALDYNRTREHFSGQRQPIGPFGPMVTRWPDDQTARATMPAAPQVDTHVAQDLARQIWEVGVQAVPRPIYEIGSPLRGESRGLTIDATGQISIGNSTVANPADIPLASEPPIATLRRAIDGLLSELNYLSDPVDPATFAAWERGVMKLVLPLVVSINTKRPTLPPKEEPVRPPRRVRTVEDLEAQEAEEDQAEPVTEGEAP